MTILPLKDILRYAVSIVMIMAGTFKIASFAAFVFSIYQFDLLPAPLVSYFALVIIFIEVAGGVLLLLGVWKKQISIMFILILSLFTAAILINLFEEKTIDCGCFGALLPNQIGWWSIVRNAMFIILLYAVFKEGQIPFKFHRKN